MPKPTTGNSIKGARFEHLLMETRRGKVWTHRAKGGAYLREDFNREELPMLIGAGALRGQRIIHYRDFFSGKNYARVESEWATAMRKLTPEELLAPAESGDA